MDASTNIPDARVESTDDAPYAPLAPNSDVAAEDADAQWQLSGVATDIDASVDSLTTSVCGASGAVASCQFLSNLPTNVMGAAANAAAIGIAWTELHGGMLHFTRVGPDLSVLSDSSYPGSESIYALAVAATPTGWLVATSAPTATLFEIDAAGRWVTARSITTSSVNNGLNVTLTAGPDGTSLLSWNARDAMVHLQQLNSEGTPLGSALVIPNVLATSSVGVSDGFALAIAPGMSPDDPFSPAKRVDLLHLGLDGTLAHGDTIEGTPDGFPLESITVASNATRIRVAFPVTNGQGQSGLCFQDATEQAAVVGPPMCSDAQLQPDGLLVASDGVSVVLARDGLSRWPQGDAGSLVETVLMPGVADVTHQLIGLNDDAVVALVGRPPPPAPDMELQIVLQRVPLP
jgi:hypothetical protein